MPHLHPTAHQPELALQPLLPRGVEWVWAFGAGARNKGSGADGEISEEVVAREYVFRFGEDEWWAAAERLGCRNREVLV